MKKLLACLICAVICLTWCGISVSATETAICRHFDVTDTNYTANTKIELNSIDNGLRQGINDIVQNFVGCEVTFKVKYSGFNSADIFSDNVNKAILIGNDYFKAYGTINGNYITFSWDEFIPTYNMWGLISDIKFCAGQDVTITDVYVYVPEQIQKRVVDLSAGACCYEVDIPLR